MAEIDTALAWKKLSLLPEKGVPPPESMAQKVPTTLAFDNIDGLEETLSGAGTSHRVNGIIVQPSMPSTKKALPKVQMVPKTKKRSLVEFIHVNIYHHIMQV